MSKKQLFIASTVTFGNKRQAEYGSPSGPVAESLVCNNVLRNRLVPLGSHTVGAPWGGTLSTTKDAEAYVQCGL